MSSIPKQVWINCVAPFLVFEEDGWKLALLVRLTREDKRQLQYKTHHLEAIVQISYAGYKHMYMSWDVLLKQRCGRFTVLFDYSVTTKLEQYNSIAGPQIASREYWSRLKGKPFQHFMRAVRSEDLGEQIDQDMLYKYEVDRIEDA
jgi:hypothetical protein